jgi:cytidine deaminase
MYFPLDTQDEKLINAARETLEKNYHRIRHTVACAVLCSSGRVYTGINVESVKGPCAEDVAIGTALTNGEREFLAVVAVEKEKGKYSVISPCGNCRQLLIIYAPEAMVIINNKGEIVKTQAKNLLPGPYLCCWD